MYHYVKGVLVHTTPLRVTVETGGVGYLVYIPFNAYAKLPAIGKNVQLHTTFIVREDSHKLYGFLASEERDLFEKLNEISGIGPKTALALIGHMEIQDLELAIFHGNAALLSKIPGIGKKTAERLIMELKDKVKSFVQSGAHAACLGEKGLIGDAISALIHLGYAPQKAQKGVQSALAASAKKPLPLADLITSALKHL